MTAIGTRSGVRAAACALAFATLFASTIGVAAAAGTTDIGVTAERDALTSGETTTVEVVVEDADGGVGALNATVTLSNPDIASVENVTIHGDPRLERITERDDGVGLSAALADTDDVGSVTVATVVLRAEQPGQTSVDLDVRALGDEDGAAYSVGNIDRPTITVNDVSGSSSDAQTSSGSVDDEAASESVDEGATPESTDDEAASESTDDGSTDSSANQESGDNDDTTGGDDQSGSAGSASAGQLVETAGGPMAVISTPAGAIGAVVVILGAFVLRRLR
jgi:hypothetical protein